MDITPYLTNLRRMAARTCTVEIDNARRARSQLAEVVRVLVDGLGVRRVILFGSLLDGRLPRSAVSPRGSRHAASRMRHASPYRQTPKKSEA